MMKRFLRILIWFCTIKMAVGIIIGATLGVLYTDEVVAYAHCVAHNADKLAAIGSCF